MNTFLQWTAPEFEKTERGVLWHAGIVAVGALIGIFCLWQQNYVFLLFVVIAVLLMLFLNKSDATVYTYGLVPDGIEVDGELVYNLRSLTGFALIDDGASPYGELVLRRTKRLTQYVRILIPREQMEAARMLLGGPLTEFVYNETLGEYIMKRLGF